MSILQLPEPIFEGQRGRPGVRVGLAADGAYTIGIDVGTMTISCVLLDLQMNVVYQFSTPTGINYKNPEFVLKVLLELPLKALEKTRIAKKKILGVCVSIPGLVDHYGNVVNAPFLEWLNFPLEQRLKKAWSKDWKCFVHNDAVCFSAAERAVETAAESGNVLLLHLAEGIGGSLVTAGVVLHGAHGFAGEVGHTIITARGITAPFEQFAGKFAFDKVMPQELSVSDGVTNLLARNNEPAVLKALSNWAEALAIGLINFIHILDPGRVVLGGPLALLYVEVADKVQRLVEKGLLAGFTVPEITTTRFGKDGAAVGAAALVRETIFELPNIDIKGA
jgi:predicted NBD/HSP70 family sugar kinase